MRNIAILIAGALAISGCSAAKSAIGALSPKAPNVTVVNNIDAAPAPAQTVVERQEKKRGFFEKVGIVTTTTIVGAGLGALAGDALDADVASSAMLGAAVGGVAGVAIVKE